MNLTDRARRAKHLEEIEASKQFAKVPLGTERLQHRELLFLMSPFMGGRMFRSSGAGIIIHIWFYKHFAATRLSERYIAGTIQS